MLLQLLATFRQRRFAALLMALGFGYGLWTNYQTGEVMPVFGGFGLGCFGIALLTFCRKTGYALRQVRDFWLPLGMGVALWTTGGVLDLYGFLQLNAPLIAALVVTVLTWVGTWGFILQRRRNFTGRYGEAGGR